MDLRQTFATNLRRLRHKAGLSQEELADQASINRTYISKLESGTCYVGLEIIGKLTDVFGVEPADFFRKISKRSQRTRQID